MLPKKFVLRFRWQEIVTNRGDYPEPLTIWDELSETFDPKATFQDVLNDFSTPGSGTSCWFCEWQ